MPQASQDKYDLYRKKIYLGGIEQSNLLTEERFGRVHMILDALVQLVHRLEEALE